MISMSGQLAIVPVRFDQTSFLPLEGGTAYVVLHDNGDNAAYVVLHDNGDNAAHTILMRQQE